jgi:hypothetical protein
MEKKHVLLAGVVVVAIVGALVFPSARWGVFTFKATEVVNKVGREPTAEQVLALPDALRAEAKKVWLDPAGLKVDLSLERRSMAGVTAFVYLDVHLAAGGRETEVTIDGQRGRRIETVITPDLLDRLAEGGVDVSRMRAGD